MTRRTELQTKVVNASISNKAIDFAVPCESIVSQARSTRFSTRAVALGLVIVGLVGQLFIAKDSAGQEHYYRIQLQHGGQYLDANHCSPEIGLNPGSDWEDGACQLWRFVPAGDGWFRIQLKHGGQYLDADHCGTRISLNPGSDWENGACQLWRLIPAGGEWRRLQLKHGGQYLDADHCGPRISLNPGSTWENGACELWRLVRADSLVPNQRPAPPPPRPRVRPPAPSPEGVPID